MALGHSQIEMKPAIVLASTSARRRSLLGQACEAAGVGFSWVDPGVDDGELSPGGVSLESFCVAMAYMKAKGGLERMCESGRAIGRVVGADTVCLHGDEAIGKPRDSAHARAMIERFMDDDHDVITGVAILDGGGGDSRELLVDRATVRVGSIDSGELDRYIQSGNWRGKAGGYNLFERLDAGWPIEFEGDPTTIVGLPMRMLKLRLGLHRGSDRTGCGTHGGAIGGAA